MKASELLEKVKSGEGIPCDACDGHISADEVLGFVFKLGKLAPRMENANVGGITCASAKRRTQISRLRHADRISSLSVVTKLQGPKKQKVSSGKFVIFRFLCYILKKFQ